MDPWLTTARFRRGGPVHVVRIPEVDQGVVRTACGVTADPDELVPVREFTGAPCSGCVMVMMGCSAVVDEPVETTAPTGDPVHPEGRYAVAFRGVREAHLVEPGAVRGQLDGRAVVQTLCCHLGWGPLASAPHGWPLCAECARLAGWSAS